MMMTMKCDLCGTDIPYDETTIHHYTIWLDGKLNAHTHVCIACEKKHGLKIQAVDLDSTGTLSNDEAKSIIENEGIGYAVQSYISGDEFKDPETRRLWNEADKALSDLESYLGDFDS